MGCTNSHLENEAEYFLDDVYKKFPLKKYSYEEIEDIYEKNLNEFISKEHFLQLFNAKFDNGFRASDKKAYHQLMIAYITNHLSKISSNSDLFKYNFLLFLFPYLNHSINKEELLNNFKEIIIFLCDFKKSQIEIVRKLQMVLYSFFHYVIYDIPEVFANSISNSNLESNPDSKYLSSLNSKINFFNRKKLDELVNSTINTFFSLVRSKALNDALNETFEKIPLNYFDIQKYFCC